MNQEERNTTKIPRIYRILEKITILKKLARKGGIRFKWGLLIVFILLFVIVVFGITFMFMSSNALLKANDNLCLTIARNISSTEPILTAEKKPYKRSLILQDVVSSLSRSKIEGLQYAAVYDLDGKISERKRSYAAHTDSARRGKWIPRKKYQEIKSITEFTKERVFLTYKKGDKRPCYQYRMPFTFFSIPVGVIEIVFSEEYIFGPIREMAKYIIIFGSALLIICIYLSTRVSGGMVRPIKRLADSMHRVRDGHLDTALLIYRHDELGDLSTEFNNMVSHLREKLFMQKFVSDSTISMIREKTQSGTGNDLDLGGSRQNLAFLFSDVRGFTAMSEKLEPEEVVSILNTYLDMQSQIIKKHGGDIDKFVGDEIMAVFSGKTRADNALKASVEIIENIKLLNKEREDEGLITVDVGIGLHIGDVVHGRMGSRDRMDNTSIGDAVNLSARLCSQAGRGMILASEKLMASAEKKKYKGQRLDPIKVKGKEKPIKIFSIEGMKK